MAGFIISINGIELVSVSNEGLNILTVQVAGDVKGEELAEINVFGGHYGSEDKDKHLIWVSSKEIKNDDEIEIEFLESVETSYLGKTIDELYQKNKNTEEAQESMEDLFESIKNQPRIREKYSFKLTPSFGNTILAETNPEDYSFVFTAMWKWLKPDTASVSISSNTLEGIKNRKVGTTHAKVALGYKTRIKLCIGT